VKDVRLQWCVCHHIVSTSALPEKPKTKKKQKRVREWEFRVSRRREIYCSISRNEISRGVKMGTVHEESSLSL